MDVPNIQYWKPITGKLYDRYHFNVWKGATTPSCPIHTPKATPLNMDKSGEWSDNECVLDKQASMFAVLSNFTRGGMKFADTVAKKCLSSSKSIELWKWPGLADPSIKDTLSACIR